MRDTIDNVVINSKYYLSRARVESHNWLITLKDIITYGRYNPNCYFGQCVGRHTNTEDKIYYMIKHNNPLYGYYPICLTDIFKNGSYNIRGYFALTPRLQGLTINLDMNFTESNITHYKIYVNSGFITEDYIPISNEFVTAPYIFSTANDIILYLYEDNDGTKILKRKCALHYDIQATDLTTGVIIDYI